MPGVSRCNRGDYTRVLPTHCTRGCGCNGHPAFPTPSMGRRISATIRARRAAGRERVSRRHCEERSDEAIHSSFARPWIASRSLSLDAHSRDPFARNDGFKSGCLIIESVVAPFSRPSSPTKAGDPVFRDVSDGRERPRRTGYPACAGYDGSLRGESDEAIHSSFATWIASLSLPSHGAFPPTFGPLRPTGHRQAV
jgi:hypothetical protein